MQTFAEFTSQIENPDHRARVEEVLNWVAGKFPTLAQRIAWSQPMFTDHGTFIIGFSLAKNHMAVAPEYDAMAKFSDEIKKPGYSQTEGMFRIPWDSPVDYALLEKIIAFNITDKADCTTFWRK